MDKKIKTISESIDEVFNAYFNEKAKDLRKPEKNNRDKPKNRPNSNFKAKDK